MKEQELVQQGWNALLRHLEAVPFIQAKPLGVREGGQSEDLRFSVLVGAQTFQIIAEVKSSGQPRLARLAALELKEKLANLPDAYGVVITPYISPAAAEVCRMMGVGYADLAGNCHISFGTVYIHQEGRPNLQVQKRVLRSFYAPKAERVIRVLLTDPSSSWKMTELAAAAQVSLGQVANVKKLLADREWLEPGGAGILLKDPRALLEEWVTHYNFRRNGEIGLYTLEDLPESEHRLASACESRGIRYALSGFSAAARYAPVVRYQRAEAYAAGEVESLVADLGWKQVPSGANFRLLLPYDNGVFYGVQERDGIQVVSPLQAYLDVQSQRSRGQEAADALRKSMEQTW